MRRFNQEGYLSPSKRGYLRKRMYFCSHKRTKRNRVTPEAEVVELIRETNEGFCSSNTFSPTKYQCRKKKTRSRKKVRENTASRRWTLSSIDFSNCKRRIVIVSYNVLGVDNASNHPDLYYNVHPKFLNWEGRKILIHKEVIHYDPSIMCFQEVDRFNDLENLFVKDGYKGIHKARTGDACDGCAIFWKDEQFTLLHQENIEFRRFGLRDNVAQLCILKMKCVAHEQSSGYSDQYLLVGNIHALFNPKRGDIKLGQARVLLDKAFELSKQWGNIPIVLAGDLNSVPQSALYRFLSSSELNIQLFPRKCISGQFGAPLNGLTIRSQREHAVRLGGSLSRPFIYNWAKEEIELASGNSEVTLLQHNLKLCSAYVGVPGDGGTRDGAGEPLATSCHSKFMGTVDYIWHTEELTPVRVLETFPLGVLSELGGLPSKEWGSDHLALVCELAFANDSHPV